MELILQPFISKIYKQMPPVGGIFLPPNPPSHGRTIAPRYKYAFDAATDCSIWYDDEPHLYFVELSNRYRFPLLSVTTFIHQMSKPFDEQVMSYRCALKDEYTAKCLDTSDWGLLSTEERAVKIRAAWKQNSLNASNYGTFVHYALEGTIVYRNQDVSSIYQMACSALNQDYPIAQVFMKKFIDCYRSQLGHLQIIAEPLIYDLSSFIAGQSDLVMLDHIQKVIYIMDYKTNEKKPGTDTVYNKMLPPFDYLDDVSLTHYCIQICLYQYLVWKSFPDYHLGINTILWLDRETGEIEPVMVDPSEWWKEIQIILGIGRGVANSLKVTYQNYFTENLFKLS